MPRLRQQFGVTRLGARIIAGSVLESASTSNTEASKRPLTVSEVKSIGGDTGQRVTWIGAVVTSQSSGKGTQHIFFGKGPDGEGSFENVFIAEEPAPFNESPMRRILKDLRQAYTEEHHKQWKEEQARREEARRRESEDYRKAGKEGVRKRIEDTRKRLEEARQLEKIEERRASGKDRESKPLPIFVTVKGTVSRFDTLILLGYGTRYNVPVLKNVTVLANP